MGLVNTNGKHPSHQILIFPQSDGYFYRSVSSPAITWQTSNGSTMGSYQAIYAIGMMAGPLISGVIASIYGIESVFFTGVGITLIGMAIISNFKLK